MLSKKSLQQEQLVKFHAYLEKRVEVLEYGTLSVNVILQDGVPKFDSINIVAQKRTKFPTERVVVRQTSVIIDKRQGI